MRWAIKHKSGRTLFVTSDEFIANNRRKMGWIVEEVKMTSREQFEQWIKKETGFDLCRTNHPMAGWADQKYEIYQTHLAWMAWKASREEIEIQACPCPNDHGPNVDDHYREQINNAGLKVKK